MDEAATGGGPGCVLAPLLLHRRLELERLTGTNVRRLRQLANLELALARWSEDLCVGQHEALPEFVRLFPGLRPDDRAAADELLRLGERAVSDAQLPSSTPDTGAPRARQEPSDLDSSTERFLGGYHVLWLGA